MQLADVRMYAQKESRRGSRPEQIEIRRDDDPVRLSGARDGEALEQGQ